jgi:hypothetical protein
MQKLALIIAIVSLAVSSGAVVYSVRETRTQRINPELERLALAFFKAEEERRAHGRQVDAANARAEANIVVPLPTPTLPDFGVPPKGNSRTSYGPAAALNYDAANAAAIALRETLLPITYFLCFRFLECVARSRGDGEASLCFLSA